MRETMESRYSLISNKYGTPVHVFDEDILRKNIKKMKSAWEKLALPMHVLYSVKTNYLPRILEIMSSSVDGADVVSGYELRAAVKAGFRPENITFNGPMKTAQEVKEAVRLGVNINVDCPSDLKYIADHCAGSTIYIGLRVNPEIQPYPSPDETYNDQTIKKLRKAKFGWPINSEGLENLLKEIEELDCVELSRLHLHMGSQIIDEEAFASGVDKAFRLFSQLKNKFPIGIINIGGGFGVEGIYRQRNGPMNELLNFLGKEYFEPKKKGLNLELLTQKINHLVDYYKMEGVTLQCEPGRFLVSDSMDLLTKVVGVKEYGESYGTWVIVDGGLNILPTAGPTEEHAFELFENETNRRSISEVSVMLGGPLCYDGDVYSYGVKFRRQPDVGDHILIKNTGAYSISRSTNFIRPRAPVVEILRGTGGGSKLIWRGETDEDIFQFSQNSISDISEGS